MDRISSAHGLWSFRALVFLLGKTYDRVRSVFNIKTNLRCFTVAACPYLATPTNGTKSYKDKKQQNNLEGAVVQFTCNEGLEVSGPAERTCQESGKWTGSGETECLGE